MDVESALEQAAGAIRQGNKRQAQIILADVIQQEPRNEAAWLLLADAVERKEHAVDCLERVLKFNPNSQVARKKLASLNEVGYSSTPKQGSPKEETASIGAPSITPSNEVARQTLDGLPPASRRANFKFLIPAVIGILGFCILGGSGLFVFREYFLDNRTIALLSVTTPAPTATPPPVDTATPAPPPTPTATPIPLAQIDLGPLLVQSGDFPSGIKESGNIDDTFDRYPTADNTIYKYFVFNNSKRGFALHIAVLLYESPASVDLAYRIMLDRLGEETQSVTDVGDRAAVGWKEVPVTEWVGIEWIELAFVRCHAVVHVSMLETVKLDDILLYSKKLDGRLVPVVCR